MFVPNVVAVISDGLGAAMGGFSAGFEHFAPWKTIDGRELVTDRSQLEVLVRGVFDPARFVDLLRNFVVFSDEPSGLVKRVAKYHQYWAVNAAVSSTVKAAGVEGDRRGGVVWHTQGSGKSFEMLCYAAKLMREPAMANPTLVLITDRNDLDDQLFGEVFAPARNLPETPHRAESRVELRQMLDRVSGGIIFTTIQKFAPEEKGDVHPELTDRRNVVVIADEAHRSQYDFLDGYARHLRDAFPVRHIWGSREHRSRRLTSRLDRSSAITSTSTTSLVQSRTVQRSASSTSLAWPRCDCRKRRGLKSMPKLRRLRRGKSLPRRSAQRADGLAWKR